jgi:hypothetical protein
MTREFQPGDKVSLPRHIRTVKTVEQHNAVGLRMLYFEDGSCGLVDNFELVEPVVTHRELREVCERHIAWYSHPSIQLALKQFMHALTEEAKT